MKYHNYVVYKQIKTHYHKNQQMKGKAEIGDGVNVLNSSF